MSTRLPVAAIVGRPNVGKSSLFNRLAGGAIAIVDPTGGVTRDRLSAVVEEGDFACELLDTGGIGAPPQDEFRAEIEAQITLAMEKADLILWAVDVREGIAPGDREIAERLRSLRKPVLVLANKADSAEWEPEAAVFFALGFKEPLSVSARSGHNLRELRRRLWSLLKAAGPPAAPEKPELRLAVVGRRNAGKSSLVNALAREERVIVSPVPGTTRDAVDVRVEALGKTLVVVDTAGFRKKRKQVKDDLDFYSLVRGERAIRRAHVVLLLVDVREEISDVEKKLAEVVLSAGKPVIVGVNKWDLAGALDPARYDAYLSDRLAALKFSPRVCLSAKTGWNALEAVRLAFELFEQSRSRLETGPLNRLIKAAAEERLPRSRGGKFPRIYYGTQVSVSPPTIVVFVNDAALFGADYQRYLAERVRAGGPFGEVPVRFVFRGKGERKGSERAPKVERSRGGPKQKSRRGAASIRPDRKTAKTRRERQG